MCTTRRRSMRPQRRSSTPRYGSWPREPVANARVFFIDEAAPKAFAAGRDSAHDAVAVTTGIMRALSARAARRDGARTHLRRASRHPDLDDQRDDGRGDRHNSPISRCSSAAATAKAGPPIPIAGLAVAFLAPLAASLIQVAISRGAKSRPTAAAPSCRATREGSPRRCRRSRPTRAARPCRRPSNPATAQMMIVNPPSVAG